MFHEKLTGISFTFSANNDIIQQKGGVYMDRNNRSFARLENTMTIAIIAAFILFLIFLFASGYGVAWLKIICAIFSILIPALSLGYLYLTLEWRKLRSRWMVAAYLALLLCTIVSLILQFPSPAP